MSAAGGIHRQALSLSFTLSSLPYYYGRLVGWLVGRSVFPSSSAEKGAEGKRAAPTIIYY